jgi:hypothetical protein
MNHPNLDTKDFWWNKINDNKDKNNTENSTKNNNKDNNNNINDNKNDKDNINKKEKDFFKKLDYPFVLRYFEIKEKKEEDIYYMKLIHCPLCPWYSYCPGCIIDPRGDLSKITSKQGIVVDWCYNFIEEELSTFNLKPTIKEIDSQIISENLPIMDKEQNYQSIQDCFNLFFEEEDLEDPLYCFHCEGPESFSKKIFNK